MLRTRKLTNESDEKLQVIEFYEEAFPPKERMPFDLMLEISQLDNADLCSVYDDDEFVAFYLLIRNENLRYVSFLAVTPAKRGQGYGTKILNYIRENYADYDLILDEEPVDPEAPNIAQREARERFYTRNGFVSTGYIITAYGQDYEILNTGGDFDIEDYFNIFRSIGFNTFRPTVKKTPND